MFISYTRSTKFHIKFGKVKVIKIACEWVCFQPHKVENILTDRVIYGKNLYIVCQKELEKKNTLQTLFVYNEDLSG